MPDFDHETALLLKGAQYVAGVDEVGRGPLAGPVVAAAVILNPDHIPQGLNDSKTLSAIQRAQLFPQIMNSALVGVAFLPPRAIDHMNIREASLDAMRRALTALSQQPDHALIDGRDVPKNLNCAATALIKGDLRSFSIAAASIVAKVLRDRLMQRLARSIPGYGFETNMGYPTAFHRAAIARLGGTPHHRFSFAPFKNGTVQSLDE